MDINDYLSNEVCAEIRRSIKKAADNEVFFLGITDKNKKVNDVHILARGNKFSVPAILRDLKAGNVVIHNHPSGKLTPSDADNSIASYLGQFGVASYIVNNKSDDIYVIVEPFDNEIIKELDTNEITGMFQKKGLLDKQLDYYEYRPQQIEMSGIIIDAYNNNRLALIEASTGTGKTISYLLPSIIWSIRNNEKCVIATNTINLQEQLINKDLPLLKRLLPVEFKYILMKGRSNYICLHKFYRTAKQPDLFDLDENKRQIDELLDWIRVTSDGSRSSLNFIPENKLWESVCADTDYCLRNKCAHFNDCFLNKVRREASSANILIVNHHILMSDIVLRHKENDYKMFGILPAYRRVIFDEAHNLEDTAIKHLGISLSVASLNKMLNKMYFVSKGKERGSLAYIKNSILHSGIIDGKFEISAFMNERIVNEIHALKNEIDIAFEIIKQYFYSILENNDEEGRFNFKTRIVPSILAAPGYYENCEKILINLIKIFGGLSKNFDTLIKRIKPKNDDDPAGELSIIKNDLISAKERIDTVMASIGSFVKPENFENTVRWVECPDIGKKEFKLFAMPLDISSLFFESAVLPQKTLIFTSATLTIDKKFEFFKKSFGINNLDKKNISELILDTPFDYEKQAVFAVPSDICLPEEKIFTEHTSGILLEILTRVERNTFALFTSYSQLKKSVRLLREPLENAGFNVYVQGEHPRSYLFDMFKKNRKSILFGADSFWEGVDAQGETLEIVIIFKLPFKSPDDPVVEAKTELLKKQGKNAFFEYQLPKAVIKLKQGVGRLIRTKTDRGVIIIFDKRIKSKYYGRTFINSLPPLNMQFISSNEIIQMTESFFLAEKNIQVGPNDC